MRFVTAGDRARVVMSVCTAIACCCLAGCAKLQPTTTPGISAQALAALNATVPPTLVALVPTATFTFEPATIVPTPSVPSKSVSTVDPIPVPTALVQPESANPSETPMIGVMARVVEVLDGDSMIVELPDGPREISYWGCAMPDDISDWQSKQCASGNRLLLGCGQVRLEPEPLAAIMDVPRYNVWDGDTLLNAELVRLGYACADELLPGSRYERQIREQQVLAENAGLGIWSIPPTVVVLLYDQTPDPTAVPESPAEMPLAAASEEPSPTEMLPSTEMPQATDAPYPTDTPWLTETPLSLVPTDAPSATPAVAPTSTMEPTVAPTPAPTQAPTAEPTQAPTATSLPAPAAGSSSSVIITDVFYDGIQGRTEPDEYCEIGNQGGSAVDVTGWRLNAGANGQDFVFPEMILAAGQVCRVYTNEVHDEWGGLSFESGSALWKNSGDCGYLYDASGVEAHSYCYD